MSSTFAPPAGFFRKISSCTVFLQIKKKVFVSLAVLLCLKPKKLHSLLWLDKLAAFAVRMMVSPPINCSGEPMLSRMCVQSASAALDFSLMVHTSLK